MKMKLWVVVFTLAVASLSLLTSATDNRYFFSKEQRSKPEGEEEAASGVSTYDSSSFTSTNPATSSSVEEEKETTSSNPGEHTQVDSFSVEGDKSPSRSTKGSGEADTAYFAGSYGAYQGPRNRYSSFYKNDDNVGDTGYRRSRFYGQNNYGGGSYSSSNRYVQPHFSFQPNSNFNFQRGYDEEQGSNFQPNSNFKRSYEERETGPQNHQEWIGFKRPTGYFNGIGSFSSSSSNGRVNGYYYSSNPRNMGHRYGEFDTPKDESAFYPKEQYVP